MFQLVYSHLNIISYTCPGLLVSVTGAQEAWASDKHPTFISNSGQLSNLTQSLDLLLLVTNEYRWKRGLCDPGILSSTMKNMHKTYNLWCRLTDPGQILR